MELVNVASPMQVSLLVCRQWAVHNLIPRPTQYFLLLFCFRVLCQCKPKKNNGVIKPGNEAVHGSGHWLGVVTE